MHNETKRNHGLILKSQSAFLIEIKSSFLTLETVIDQTIFPLGLLSSAVLSNFTFNLTLIY